MSKPAFTLKVFSIYLNLLGASLMIAPNLLLPLFGFPPTTEVWIRVAGVLVFNIGIYYRFAASNASLEFFMASAYARFFVLVAFSAFVLFGLARPALILIGSIDFFGGIWTLLAVKHDRAG